MNANDPRLTAHALSEADAESAELITSDPTLAAESEQVRRFADALRAALNAEPAPTLADEQRDAVLAEARAVCTGPEHWWQRGPALAAAAACAILAIATAVYFQARHLESLRPVADAASPVTLRVPTTLTTGTQVRLAPEDVVPPHAQPALAQPALRGPEIQTTHIPPTGLPVQPPTIEQPTALTTASPAREIRVEPETVPMFGSRPRIEKPSAVQSRATSRPATPKR